jgi:Xaa-Pro aminopeptidase
LHEFIRNGATGPAYASIIAGGKNACVLHYVNNCEALRAGDVLLMDFGAEYGHYSADLTRCVPVNGRFTPRQRAVYDAVLRVHRYAASILKPGVDLGDPFSGYSGEVSKRIESELFDLGLLTPEQVRNQDPEKPLFRKYYPHGVSHALGLDTHDVGKRYLTVKPGMVFTIEPGIYIEAEGLGIRIENDFLVTENGVVDLMAHIPIEAEEIEARMAAC